MSYDFNENAQSFEPSGASAARRQFNIAVFLVASIILAISLVSSATYRAPENGARATTFSTPGATVGENASPYGSLSPRG
jgi:hypothetical protein